jgi:hypothetical protein
MLLSHSSISSNRDAVDLEVIVAAMQHHEAATDIQHWGLSVLHAIVEARGARGASEALEHGCIALVVVAMNSHLAHIGLQREGEVLLSTIAKLGGDDAVHRILEEGGIEAIMAASRAHPECRELRIANGTWRAVLQTTVVGHTDSSVEKKDIANMPEASTAAIGQTAPSTQESEAANVPEGSEEATTTASESDPDEDADHVGSDKEPKPCRVCPDETALSDDWDVEL